MVRLRGGGLFSSCPAPAPAPAPSKDLELCRQVHLAEDEDPEDEEAADADAHDEVEVGPLRLLRRLADGEVQVVGGAPRPADLPPRGGRGGGGGGGRRRRGGGGGGGGAERVVGDHGDARHLNLPTEGEGRMSRRHLRAEFGNLIIMAIDGVDIQWSVQYHEKCHLTNLPTQPATQSE